MSTLRHIRKSVLCLSQAEMAVVAEVSQGTVSKWENGELNPNRDEMARIRASAIDRGLAWDDLWFFETPESPPQAPDQQHDDQHQHADQRAATDTAEVVR